jgi:hypothetical protein
MEPLQCRVCRAAVKVRKSSWDQTSVQWHDETAAACLERRAYTGQLFEGCSALRDSIREAAVLGQLTVPGN